MPFISDADFAQFQQLKGGGGAPAGQAPAATWRPPGGALPAPVDMGPGAAPDYTAQNAEVARRSLAARNDPNSPTYVSPEQQAKQDAANQAQGAANPGWSWNASPGGGGWWTPDAAHNNAAGSQAFANSWQALGKANPDAFDVPKDAQGRPIDARTGQAMPGAQTAAQRAQQPAPQWSPPPGAPSQPGQGYGSSPTATMQPAGAAPPAQAPQQPAGQMWDPQKGWKPPTPSPGGTY